MSVSRKPSCPTGYILRDSYQSKSGKCVSSRCIRKTGLLSGKSSERTEALIKKATMRSISARRMSVKRGMTVRTNCPEGKTLRSGYTRRSYDRRTGLRGHYRHALVAPGCITKRGKTGKTQTARASSRIIVLDPEDHFLSEYGYHDVETTNKETRHKALHKLIEHFLPIKGQMATYNYVIRALNARYILNRNTNPKAARLFKADQRAISALYRKVKSSQGSSRG
jgi:hypothetical protein